MGAGFHELAAGAGAGGRAARALAGAGLRFGIFLVFPQPGHAGELTPGMPVASHRSPQWLHVNNTVTRPVFGARSTVMLMRPLSAACRSAAPGRAWRGRRRAPGP